jgi:antitoxin CptB
MLELDYLLERFLELGYGDLDAKDQAVFERLLACQDQDLQRWLVLGRPAPDPDLERLVRRLVAVASQSPQGGAS